MKVGQVLNGGAKRIAWMAGGAALATAIAVTAQQAATSSTASSAQDCALSGTINDVVNSKVQMLGMVQTDPSRYFAKDAAESCLGPIADIDSDVSDGIPDPMGFLKARAEALAKKAINAVYAKACTASRGALGDYISKYNAAVGEYNADKKDPDRALRTLDAKIGTKVQSQMNEYGLDYNASAVPKPVTNAAQAAASAVSTPAASSTTTTSGAATNSSSLGSMVFN
jgi:hypothetical protein